MHQFRFNTNYPMYPLPPVVSVNYIHSKTTPCCVQVTEAGSSDLAMPGTYHKMEAEQETSGGHRRHKHRHHGHGHKHRHERGEERESSRASRERHHPPALSTDTSLEIPRPQYEDSLYSPKDSLYGPGAKDSLYSGDDGGHGGHHHQPHHRGYGSGSDTNRFSPRHSSDRESAAASGGRHAAENTFDAVKRRSQEERIWQDAVARGAESGQIRARDPTDIQHIYLPSVSADKSGGGGRQRGEAAPAGGSTHLRGYIEPGRPGSGLAAAAALVRGDTYTPEKIAVKSDKAKVPPPVPQKPRQQQYNKMGMEELWPGGWEEYSEYYLLYILNCSCVVYIRHL